MEGSMELLCIWPEQGSVPAGKDEERKGEDYVQEVFNGTCRTYTQC